MGAVSLALGQGTEFTFKDQTYKISPWTYKIQGQFETYLEKEAIQSAQRMGKLLGPDQAQALLNKVHDDIVKKKYTFGSALVAEALNTIAHQEYLFWLMLRINHPEVTLDLVREMFEADLEAMYRAMNEANADPQKTESPKESPTPSNGSPN
jgi:hypothetical protein